MKFNELKDKESLRVINIYGIQSNNNKKDTFDTFAQGDVDDLYQYEEDYYDYEDNKDEPIRITNIAYNIIYTDGNIKDISNIETSPIESFCCYGNSMEDANTLISKDLTFENYSYIIVYFVMNANETIISKPLVYLKNVNDKDLIAKVMEVLKHIESEYNKKLINSFDIKDDSINEEAVNVYRLRR